MFHERVVMSKNFKFKKTYVWHLQTLSINQRVIANIEIDPPASDWFLLFPFHDLCITPFHFSKISILDWLIPGPFWWLRSYRTGEHVHTSSARRGTTDPGNCICYIFFHSENETVQMVRGIDYVYVVLITSRFHPGLMTRSYLMPRMHVIY